MLLEILSATVPKICTWECFGVAYGILFLTSCLHLPVHIKIKQLQKANPLLFLCASAILSEGGGKRSEAPLKMGGRGKDNIAVIFLPELHSVFSAFCLWVLKSSGLSAGSASFNLSSE